LLQSGILDVGRRLGIRKLVLGVGELSFGEGMLWMCDLLVKSEAKLELFA